ncbi:MAG: fasciclin domain-containing protein [Pseudanabaena sp.]
MRSPNKKAVCQTGCFFVDCLLSRTGDRLKTTCNFYYNQNKDPRFNDTKVTKSDIQGNNGVIPQIDNVILPPSL